MTVDYYSLLTKAVAGKDAAARDQIYKDAFSLIARSHLTREAAASHAAALEDAVRRIEDEIAAEEASSAAAISETLSTGRNWKPSPSAPARSLPSSPSRRWSTALSQPKAPPSSQPA